jgi:hypothetical protein
MKTTTMLLAGAVMLAAASSAAAQDPTPGAQRKTYTVPCNWKGDSQMIVKRYRDCLRSENPGVVEAALAHILWMNIAVPCVDVSPLKADVDRIATKGGPAAIRFRAYLTAMVLEDPEAFKSLAAREFEGPADLFAGVTHQMYASGSADLYTAATDSR